jgi:hypothetical protein
MEISIGFDKSTSKLFIFAIIYAELVSASYQLNEVLLIRYFIITPNINLLIRDLKLIPNSISILYDNSSIVFD